MSGEGFYSYRREVAEKKESRRSRRAAGRSSFTAELGLSAPGGAAEVLPEVSDDDAAVLLDAVFESGDRLKRHLDTRSLVAYKEAVRAFISTVVSHGLAVQEHTSGANILKRKRYALVQVVDRKLEQLAAGMLASQRNQIELLAKIDEINGLIVDLTR